VIKLTVSVYSQLDLSRCRPILWASGIKYP